jgi:hypothetical protein
MPGICLSFKPFGVPTDGKLSDQTDLPSVGAETRSGDDSDGAQQPDRPQGETLGRTNGVNVGPRSGLVGVRGPLSGPMASTWVPGRGWWAYVARCPDPWRQRGSPVGVGGRMWVADRGSWGRKRAFGRGWWAYVARCPDPWVPR